MRAITRRAASTIGLLAATGALMTAAAVPVTAAVERPAAKPAPTSSSCHLGNGVQHVINITFDNVHFFRDNPNVPSDLEQMPTLMKFLQSNGVVMSNMHTPLIAHTAEDSLAIYSGLYGDRHGMPVSNSYKSYTGVANGATEPDTSFVYWNSPVINNTTKAPSTVNTHPSMVYSPTVPAANAAPPAQTAPEPWVALQQGRLLVRRVLLGEHGAGEQRRHPDRVRLGAVARPLLQQHERVHRRGRALRPR